MSITTARTRRKTSTTNNNFRKSGTGNFNALTKTRDQLPSEAFSKVLKSVKLPKIKTIATSDKITRQVQSNNLFNKHLKNFTYSPSPVSVGQPYSLNSKELREVQEKICRDRQQRREVLFALKKAGKGNKVKEAKWSLSSLVRC